MHGRLPALALLGALVALAGCSGAPCTRVPVPAAHDVATAASTAGDGPIQVQVRAVDDLTGDAVGGAAVRAFWKDGDARAADGELEPSEGGAYRSAEGDALRRPDQPLYLPANLTLLDARTDAHGAATLRLPGDQSVGYAYTAPGHTEEVGVFRTPHAGGFTLELDLLPTRVAATWSRNWTVAVADPGLAPNPRGETLPLPRDTAFASDRFTDGTVRLAWQNEPTADADLGLSVAVGGDQDSQSDSLGNQLGKHQLEVAVPHHGPWAESVLRVGVEAAGPQASPLGQPIPYTLDARLGFARSASDYHACLAPAPREDGGGDGAGEASGHVPAILYVVLPLLLVGIVVGLVALGRQ